jgi:hypothetical protein
MLKKYLYIAGGLLAVVLGTVGIFVPGLPTTPFLLLASWLFYNSSERMHAWLNNSFLGSYIKRYQQKGGVSWATKLTSIGLMLVMINISIFFILSSTRARLIVAALGVVGTCCVLFVVPGPCCLRRKKVLAETASTEADK